MPLSIEFNNRTIKDPADSSLLELRKQTLITNFQQNITQTNYLMQTQIPFF